MTSFIPSNQYVGYRIMIDWITQRASLLSNVRMWVSISIDSVVEVLSWSTFAMIATLKNGFLDENCYNNNRQSEGMFKFDRQYIPITHRYRRNITSQKGFDPKNK